MLTENIDEIKIGESIYALKHDIRTALNISQSFGGLKIALTKIQDYDVNSFSLLLRSCGILIEKEKLSEEIFKTGLIPIANTLTMFLIKLMNGGRIISQTEEVESEAGK
jgi:hypothetical protein